MDDTSLDLEFDMAQLVEEADELIVDVELEDEDMVEIDGNMYPLSYLATPRGKILLNDRGKKVN